MARVRGRERAMETWVCRHAQMHMQHNHAASTERWHTPQPSLKEGLALRVVPLFSEGPRAPHALAAFPRAPPSRAAFATSSRTALFAHFGLSPASTGCLASPALWPLAWARKAPRRRRYGSFGCARGYMTSCSSPLPVPNVALETQRRILGRAALRCHSRVIHPQAWI